MNAKRHLDRPQDKIERTLKNTHDTIDQTLHESAAQAQRSRRESDGDEMTTKEKIVSHADELRHRVDAGVDEVKKKARGDY